MFFHVLHSVIQNRGSGSKMKTLQPTALQNVGSTTIGSTDRHRVL